jgi:hypothetical protein
MHPEPYLTAQFLTLVALIAATIEYCEMLRRRREARARAALAAEAQASGLIGMVRVFAADDPGMAGTSAGT